MKLQKGSAHAIIIVGLVVLLVGALGFIFWQNFLASKPATVKSESKTVVKKDDKNDSEKKELKTLSIDPYKVKFTIPDTLADTTVMYESRQIGESSFITLTTQRVVDLGGDCAKGYPFGDLVTLSRDSQSSSNQYQVYTSEMIDGYYYHIGTVESGGLDPKSTCSSNTQAKSDLDSLVAGLKTLESQN